MIVRVVYRPEQETFAARHLQAAIGAIEKFSADFVPYPVVDHDRHRSPGRRRIGCGRHGVSDAGHDRRRLGVRAPGHPAPRVRDRPRGRPQLVPGHARVERAGRGVDGRRRQRVGRRARDGRPLRRAHERDRLGWVRRRVRGAERAFTEDPANIPSPIATAAYAFVDSDAYGAATYIGTDRALRTLERIVGSSEVHGRDEDLRASSGRSNIRPGAISFATLEHELGKNLTGTSARCSSRSAACGWPCARAVPRPAHAPRGVFGDGAQKKIVTEADAPDTGAVVRARSSSQNTGVIHVPIDVELQFADGSAQRVPLGRSRPDARGSASRSSTASRLVEVKLDPDNKLALDVPIHASVPARRRWRRIATRGRAHGVVGRRRSCRWSGREDDADHARRSRSAPARARSRATPARCSRCSSSRRS